MTSCTEKVHPFKHLNVCQWFLLQGALQMALLSCTAAHHIGRRRPLPPKSIIPGQNGDTCLKHLHDGSGKRAWAFIATACADKVWPWTEALAGGITIGTPNPFRCGATIDTGA